MVYSPNYVIYNSYISFQCHKMSGKSSFSEDLIGEFQEAFMLFDTKGDGMIPVRIKNIK